MELWRHVNFPRQRLAAILDFTWVFRPSVKCDWGSWGLVYKFGVDQIYSFGDITILPWNCLIMWLFQLHMCRINGKFTSRVETIHILGVMGWTCLFTIQFQKWRFSNKWCLLVKSSMLRPFTCNFGPKFGWVMWPVNKGSSNPWPQFAYSTCNFQGVVFRTRGVYSWSPPC